MHWTTMSSVATEHQNCWRALTLLKWLLDPQQSSESESARVRKDTMFSMIYNNREMCGFYAPWFLSYFYVFWLLPQLFNLNLTHIMTFLQGLLFMMMIPYGYNGMMFSVLVTIQGIYMCVMWGFAYIIMPVGCKYNIHNYIQTYDR